MASSRHWLAGAVALSALVVGACTPVHPASVLTTPGTSSVSRPSAAGSTMIIDQAGPPPLVLDDTSPGQLAAQVHLAIGGYDPASRNVAELSIVFLHEGRWVKFVRGERLSCNGISLPGPGTAFDLKLPADTIGGKQVVCGYTSGAKSATLLFTVPPVPAILSPADGSLVARGRATLVRFNVGGQNTMFYITALGTGTKNWIFPWGDPPTGATANPRTEATLDTHALAAGSGSITLVQSFNLADLRGPDFQRVEGNGEGVAVISVTWA